MFDAGELIAGRYRLLEPYPGVLPYGQMWVAEDTFLSYQVRMILSEQLPSESVLRAAASVALVDSEALVKVMSLCSEDDPFTWICTQLPMGTPLSAFLGEGESLSPQLVHSLTGELARVLSLLRTNDVSHLQLAPQWVRIGENYSVGLDGAGVLAGLAGADLDALPGELDRLEARGLCAFAARLLWDDPSASDAVLFERMAGMDLPAPLANLFERERSNKGVLSPAEAVRVLTPWQRVDSMPRQRVFSPWFRPYQHASDVSGVAADAPVNAAPLAPGEFPAVPASAVPPVKPHFPPVHATPEPQEQGGEGRDLKDAASESAGEVVAPDVSDARDVPDVAAVKSAPAQHADGYDSELGIVAPPRMTIAPRWHSVEDDNPSPSVADEPARPAEDSASHVHSTTSSTPAPPTTPRTGSEEEAPQREDGAAPETSTARKGLSFDKHKRVNSSKIATFGALGVVVVAGIAAVFALSTPLRNVDIPAPVLSAPPSQEATSTPSDDTSESASASAEASTEAAPVQIVDATLLNPYAAKVNPTNASAQDNPTLLPRVFDGDPATSWQSWRYNQKNFSGKGGVGIALKLANATKVRSVTLNVNGEGGQVQWRATTADAPDGGEVIASATLGANTVLSAEKPVETDTVILWFSELPTAADGKNRIDLSEVTVQG